MTAENGATIDGVRFRSVAKAGGIKVALFGGPTLHHEDTHPSLTFLDAFEYRADAVTVLWRQQ